MATLLVMRSLVAARDPLADAKDTLSSWDKCMAKNYCKWPVIVAIIVGGIIVLSTVLCIARGRSGHKRVHTPPPRPYDPSAYSSAPLAAPIDSRPANQQYRSHAAPTFNPAPPSTLNSTPTATFSAAPKPEAPAFARFDAHSKPANEDALPAMPSWKDAKSVQVEEEVIPEKRDDVEMDRLDHNGSLTGTSMAAVAAGGAARSSPGPGRSPVQRIQTEHGYGYNQGYHNDPYATNSPRRSPNNSPGGYGGPYAQQQDGYRTQQSLSPVYGAGAGYAQGQQFDRRSPGPGYNGPPARRSPGPSYDQHDHYDQQQQYGQSNPARTPPPLNTNNYGYNNATQYQDPMDVSPVTPGNGMYNNGYAPPAALAPIRNPSPGYAPSGSTRYEPPAPSASPAPAYPGQQTYESSELTSQPAQQPYRAYTPAQSQTQGQQYAGVSRKAVEGSWKEV
ncbi:hypothetical protein N0V90_005673 [Kalmusia sp. IMI 367209]|nr:hypothetical protein N0V90_005673 [Kalmusia sp. IMI 367209]